MSRNLLLFSLFLHACVQESAPQQSSDSGAEALVDLNSPQEELGVQLDEGLHIEADEGEDLGEDLLLKPDLALTPDIALEPDVASFACADGLDNDGDGRVDLEDSDCANVVDNTENGADPDTICSNGLDDDEDGLIDFPFDPGCAAAGDEDELNNAIPRACGNEIDDDEDGLIDFPLDPGCAGLGDPHEEDPSPLPLCFNGLDDDEDGLIDFPLDMGCQSAGDSSETEQCQGEVINLKAALAEAPQFLGQLQGEGQTLGSCGGSSGPEQIFVWRVEEPLEALIFRSDFPETEKPTVLYLRRSCEFQADLVCERGSREQPGAQIRLSRPEPGLYFLFVDTGNRSLGPGRFALSVEEVFPPECRDSKDNDEDGEIDLRDPGCQTPEDPSELDPESLSECADRRDNDGDGLIDYPADPDCEAAGADREEPLCESEVPIYELEGPASLQVDLWGEELMESSCGGPGPEAVIYFRLEEPSGFSLQVEREGAPAPVALSLRPGCEQSQRELFCYSQPEQPLNRELEPGEYFLILDALSPDGLDGISVDLEWISLITQCNDGLDNDEDGFVDLFDPGCEYDEDQDEQHEALPACADGEDNDGDGAVDYPEDEGCDAAGDPEELRECAQLSNLPVLGSEGGRVEVRTSQDLYGGSCARGGSNEAVVRLDLDGPHQLELETVEGDFDTKLSIREVCDDPDSMLACDDDSGERLLSLLRFDRLDAGRYFIFVEAYSGSGGLATLEVRSSPIRAMLCEDGEDNDEDGLSDFPLDSGCSTPSDDDEADPDPLPECADGLDNDEDGLIDYPEDGECRAASGTREGISCLHRPPEGILGQEGGRAEVQTSGESHYESNCGSGARSAEAVLILQLEHPSQVRAELIEANFDTVLYIQRDCEDPGSLIACNDDGGQSTRSLLDLELEPGNYFLFVDGYSSNNSGSATLEVEVEGHGPPPPPDCNDGLDNDGDGLPDLFDPGCESPEDESEFHRACPRVINWEGEERLRLEPSDLRVDGACEAARGRLIRHISLEPGHLEVQAEAAWSQGLILSRVEGCQPVSCESASAWDFEPGEHHLWVGLRGEAIAAPLGDLPDFDPLTLEGRAYRPEQGLESGPGGDVWWSDDQRFGPLYLSGESSLSLPMALGPWSLELDGEEIHGENQLIAPGILRVRFSGASSHRLRLELLAPEGLIPELGEQLLAPEHPLFYAAWRGDSTRLMLLASERPATLEYLEGRPLLLQSQLRGGSLYFANTLGSVEEMLALILENLSIGGLSLRFQEEQVEIPEEER